MGLKKINIALDQQTHGKVKAISALKGISMNEFLEKAIANSLNKDKGVFDKAK